ncbi:LOW QUALITY PROTEIN: hypothetical protein PHMEG_00020505 [Phytophthora megakarya]|uniref:Uncharacterized protein n=1 Tax=Phytophthora megakarya TaxID=4795 RepID=A0A225VP75_9STRA|nr:LOW QUALITY PROTEIN: hypothetical protein PHMEG_00020505 [Phytophthora megakarya]
MHWAVKEALNKKKERGENLVNFAIGDYVLRSRINGKHGNKLLVTWVGPYRVTRADSHSFQVDHLETGDKMDVHASRLAFYSDDSLDVTNELLEHVSSQGLILAVDKLKGTNGMMTSTTSTIYLGLPIGDLAKGIRVLVDNYVANVVDQQLGEYWQRLCGGQVRGMVPDVQPNVDFETVSTTGALRGPQGDTIRGLPRISGGK